MAEKADGARNDPQYSLVYFCPFLNRVLDLVPWYIWCLGMLKCAKGWVWSCGRCGRWRKVRKTSIAADGRGTNRMRAPSASELCGSAPCKIEAH